MTNELADLQCEYDAISLVDDASIDTIEEFERRMEGDERNVVATLNDLGMTQQLVNGMYMRCLRIPKGMFLTGRIHKREYLDVCVYGDMTIKSFIYDGSLEDTSRHQGYEVCEGRPGRKRVGYAHEDTLWITTDRTDVDNIADALDDITVDTMAEFAAIGVGDHQDFLSLIAAAGFSEAEVRAQSEREDNQIPMPVGEGTKTDVGPSKIQGLGLFATNPIAAGEIIAPARIGDMRTPAGRYTNHSQNPNSEFVGCGGVDLQLVAKSAISSGEEITLNYRQALSFSGIHI